MDITHRSGYNAGFHWGVAALISPRRAMRHPEDRGVRQQTWPNADMAGGYGVRSQGPCVRRLARPMTIPFWPGRERCASLASREMRLRPGSCTY